MEQNEQMSPEAKQAMLELEAQKLEEEDIKEWVPDQTGKTGEKIDNAAALSSQEHKLYGSGMPGMAFTPERVLAYVTGADLQEINKARERRNAQYPDGFPMAIMDANNQVAQFAMKLAPVDEKGNAPLGTITNKSKLPDNELMAQIEKTITTKIAQEKEKYMHQAETKLTNQ